MKIKRNISLFLVLIMIMSVCSAVLTGAQETSTEKIELTFESYDVYIPVSWTNIPEATKYIFSVKGVGGAEKIETKGNYLEWYPSCYYENALVQVKAYNSSGVMIGESPTLRYDIGRVCADWIGMYGDVDYDWEVTVKDSTLIQKYIAGMEKLSISQRWNASVVSDNKINIKDATAIQKHLASVETNSRIGEEYFGGCELYYAMNKGVYSK